MSTPTEPLAASPDSLLAAGSHDADAADTHPAKGAGAAIAWFCVAAALTLIFAGLAAVGEAGAFVLLVACFAVVPVLFVMVLWAVLLAVGLVGSFRTPGRGAWWYRGVFANVALTAALACLVASHGSHIVI